MVVRSGRNNLPPASYYMAQIAHPDNNGRIRILLNFDVPRHPLVLTYERRK
jgi:hypothetical protein